MDGREMMLKRFCAISTVPCPAGPAKGPRSRSVIPFMVAAVAAASLVGCASNPVYEGGRAWNEGWREGKVEQVGFARELGYAQNYDCRYRNGGAGREAPGRFAVVGLQHMGRHRHHVVPVDEGTVPLVGDQVLTRPDRCDRPVQRGRPMSQSSRVGSCS